MKYLAIMIVTAALALDARAQVVFQPPAGYASQSQALHTGGFTAGDVSGDTLADVLIADALTGRVQRLVNQGDGTLGPAETLFFASSGVSSLELADLDGDGILDLVLVSASVVEVHLGTTQGAFSPSHSTSPSPSVHAAVVGDVTGDGIADVVTAASGQIFGGSPSIHVLPGLGDGSFDSALLLYSQSGAGIFTGRPVLGHADGDGVLDVAVVINAFGQAGEVRVFLSTGGEATHALSQGAGALGFADFDGDGLADVATANGPSGSIEVTLNDGAGGFSSSSEYSVGAEPHGLLTVDLDGDGLLDLATPNVQSADVSVLRGNGDGTFVPVLTVSGALEASGLRAADFDGDGLPDLALSVAPLLGPVAVMLNHTYGESEGFTDLGGAGAGATGFPVLLAYGKPAIGQQISFRLQNAPSGSTSWLMIGLSALELPWQGAILGPAPDLLIGPIVPTADGAAHIGGLWPKGTQNLWFQFWLTDAQPHGGLAASSTVFVSF